MVHQVCVIADSAAARLMVAKEAVRRMRRELAISDAAVLAMIDEAIGPEEGWTLATPARVHCLIEQNTRLVG